MVANDPFQSALAVGGKAALSPSLETLNHNCRLGSHPVLHIGCRKCGKVHKILKPCGDRTCTLCAKNRQRKYQKYLMKKYVSGDMDLSMLKMITLTLKSFQSCEKMVDYLLRSMRRLRQQDIWKRFAKGVYSIETEKNVHGWHVHVHILVIGGFLHYKSLKKSWIMATKGRGQIVDIRAIRGELKNVLKEACKYPFKPHNVRRWTDGDKNAFNNAVKKRRLFSPIGEWYGDSIESGTGSRCRYCDSTDIVFIEPSGITLDDFTRWYGDKGK